VFISTADQEGFGLSIAEAMIAGVPVVSSPHGLGAIVDIVEQVDTEDPQAWVNAILRAGAKADAARRFIQANYAPRVIAEKWKAFLDAACPGS
jgi:glycosyltransferase involved in cell wall biosynthesis